MAGWGARIQALVWWQQFLVIFAICEAALWLIGAMRFGRDSWHTPVTGAPLVLVMVGALAWRERRRQQAQQP
jgi:hypothetical protein